MRVVSNLFGCKNDEFSLIGYCHAGSVDGFVAEPCAVKLIRIKINHHLFQRFRDLGEIDSDGKLRSGFKGVAEDEIEGAAESPVPVSVAASPRVHVDATAEGFVKVYNSYSIKDKCRAAGFQFDAAERAWMKPAAAVLENLQAGSLEHVTSEAVLEMIQNTVRLFL